MLAERDAQVTDDHPIDENAPLLGGLALTKATRLPWGQFSLVLFLQLAESLSNQAIYPFAPQLIRDIGITGGDEKKVGYYVGIMHSIYFLTQALTILHWSRISDRVGRKPILLIGLAGLSLSMFLFGLSKTFWGLVFSRSLNGALNGNNGVMKSIVAELTDSTNIAKAYALQPIAWSSGSALGPIIGGTLAKPAERFPRWFGGSDFHKKYPYFLACAVPATFTVIAWFAALFFLKETVKSPQPIFKCNPLRSIDPVVSQVAGTLPPETGLEPERPLSLRQVLTPRVLIAAWNCASLAFMDIAFKAIQPLYYSTPVELGGLGMELPRIGFVLSLYGVLNGIFQVCFFARVCRRFGARAVFVWGIGCAVPIFAGMPVLSLVVRHWGNEGWWVGIGIGTLTALNVGMSTAYGAIFIFLAAAAPSRTALGATNGVAQVIVSLCRAFGPAMAGSLYALSIERGWLGDYFVYLILVLLGMAAVGVGRLLPSEIWESQS